MTDENGDSAPAVTGWPWAETSFEDFVAVDVNSPLANSASVDTTEFVQFYREAADAAASEQKASAGRVYSMLAALCSFHFKPSDRDEPFGPMARFNDRRTAAPADFMGGPASVLAANIQRIENPAVRARAADTVWLLDRSQGAAAQTAIDAYAELIENVRDGKKLFRSSRDIHAYEVGDHLRRGIQIARVVGWDKQGAQRMRALVAGLRADAAKAKERASFRWHAILDLDYRISDPAAIAAEAEALSAEEASLEFRHNLLHIAARAHRHANNGAESNRALLTAAEYLVTISASQGDTGMFESHWLERAIGEMQRIPGTKERRAELKDKLLKAQARILDEMTPISHTEDISELVKKIETAFSGKPLMEAIRLFALLSRAPTPAKLEAEARAQIADNPLSSLVPMTQYDSEGKPVYRDKGLEGDGEDAIQRQIALLEGLRRSEVVQARFQPARFVMAQEHYIGEDVIGLICMNSPFVPNDRTAIFVDGLVHFFHGEMIAALHTLVPQVENSLRHLLRTRGHDVTKLKVDLTQESAGLSVLLDKMRTELIQILNEQLVADIDNVFNHRSGPNLRNRVAHGLVGEGEPHADDAVYACYVIFLLVCLPVLRKWDDLTAFYEEAHGLQGKAPPTSE